MATYAELLTIATNGGTLLDTVKVACIVACDVVRSEVDTTPNHTARVAWAKATLANPDTAAHRMLWAILAQNRTFTAAQITGASDAAVQTAVNAAIDLLS